MPRNKRIFISDIHMGDAMSLQGPHPYGWFNANIPVLAQFLNDQLNSPAVKEVTILGDLFDAWVIPVGSAPLASFEAICANPANRPVIDQLKGLAASPDIKLSYVPGNHDMSMDAAGITTTRQFLENQFPGIRFICNSTTPVGCFRVGPLAAEHGDRYCLFNAPDSWTAANTFLPLGYFISRMVAYKVSQTGEAEDALDIIAKFLKNFMKDPDFVEDLFLALAKDAGLSANATFNLSGLPGFTAPLTVKGVGKRFASLLRDWEKTPGNINCPTAIVSDIGNLWPAASSVYNLYTGTDVSIVIFGHTHVPILKRIYLHEPGRGAVPSTVPCRSLYANCGAWVDKNKGGCTYVETEEAEEARRHYVRLKRYPENKCLDEGFIKT